MAPELRFRSMGVDVVVHTAATRDAERVRSLFERYDRTFSRFRADSELTHVNTEPAAFVLVSALFARVVETALRAAGATGGLVDPTLASALEAAGYDGDFASLADVGPPGAAVRGRRSEVELQGRLLRRPPGLRLDLNGVVKGLAVDDALGLLEGEALVSAGGDLAVRGEADVAVPGGPPIRIHGGGLATSSTLVRRWRRGGRPQHHLIDPRTGRPSRSRWTSVTAAAGSCTAADVAAKAALLLDGDGPEWLAARGLPAQLVGRDGVVVETPGWPDANAPLPLAA